MVGGSADAEWGAPHMQGRDGTCIDEAVLRLRDSGDRHVVTADALSSVVSGIQKMILLLGAQEQGLVLSRRFRPGRDLREHYTLVLGLPEAGSYQVPLAVYDARASVEMDAEDGFLPLHQTMAIMQSIAEGNLAEMEQQVASPRLRRYVLEAAQACLPKSGYSVELTSGDAHAYMNAQSLQTTQTWLSMRDPYVEYHLVGELVAINFLSRTIVVKYQPTGRRLEAAYDLELEEDLFDERRQLIQLSGRVLLDDEAQPTEISDVSAINVVDLSPIEIAEVHVDDVHLRFTNPFVVTPTLSHPDQQYFEVAHDRLGVDVFAHTRDALIGALHEEIVFLWKCYALEDPSVLSEDAAVLRERLLNGLVVI